jgi:uncharacterized glyoxalase superfamily protein PhnB
MPPGRIIPELVYDDLDTAVAWLCGAFGFKERLRIPHHRSQLVLSGESVIAKTSGDNKPLSKKIPDLNYPRPEIVDHSIMVHIEDIDRFYERVVQRGGKIISPPTDYPFGERQFTVIDIGGHTWTFSQSIADVDPADWGGILPEHKP